MFTLALYAVAALTQGQDFSWSGAIPQGKTLTVKNIIGSITVEAASGREASVTAVKRRGDDGDPEDVEIRRVEEGDAIIFCVIYPNHDNDSDCDMNSRNRRGRRHWDGDRNDTEVNFTVRVPAGVPLSVGSVTGDVTARGVRGETDARSVSGDVRLEDIEGKVVEASSVSGNIELERIRADEVGAETVSGDVDFSGEIRPRGEYDFKTLSGDIVMLIPRGSGADISGSTFSGDFDSSFPITTTSSSRFSRRSRVSGTIGDGSARIRLESFSGDVELRELTAR